jgi:ribosomal protein L36
LDIHVENKTLLDTDKTKIDLKDSDRYNKTIKIRKKLMIINNKNELN